MHPSRRNIMRGAGFCHRLTLRIQHHRLQRDRRGFIGLVFNLGLQADRRLLRGHLRGGYKVSPMGDMDRVDRGQPNATINSGARIPAAGARADIHLNRDHIFAADIQVRRQVVAEPEIAKGTKSQQVSVHPHLAVHVDAIKIDEHLLAFGFFGNRKALAIPTHPTRQIPHRHAVGHIRVQLLLDAPVVRHIQRPPGGIVELCLLRAVDITQMKLPVLAEIFPDTGFPVSRRAPHRQKTQDDHQSPATR